MDHGLIKLFFPACEIMSNCFECDAGLSLQVSGHTWKIGKGKTEQVCLLHAHALREV